MKGMRPPPLNKGVFVAWHHVRTTVPHDWEVTAYSVEDRIGRMEFSTRKGLQAVVSWEPCKGEPDRLTTMKTFLQNNILGKKSPRRIDSVNTEDAGVFLVGWSEDESLPCQAIAHDMAGAHIVRWVFEGYASEAGRRNVVRPVLESFDFNKDASGCEYALHGVRCRLPWDYKIEDIVTLPANVMMTFEGEKSRRRVFLRRWGLASYLLGTSDLYEFYGRVLRSLNIQYELVRRCTVNGMDGRILRFSALREHHSDRFMRRRWHNGQAVIWHDAASNRICTFEQIGPEKSEALAFESVFPGLSVS